ncbi:MAG: hypothetical protein RMM31_05235 [Anaerolineae bacterium]|nr:hypothetical protein [Thermoflexales bacterium]MDW8395631.1 hypothetical protein [Anaerolineae bacterium]
MTNAIRKTRDWLANVRVSERAALLIVVVSTVIFLALAVLWLWLSTENVALLEELERLEQQQIELQEQSNQLWVEISEVTSPRVMVGRARQLGFAPPEEQEVLLTGANR